MQTLKELILDDNNIAFHPMMGNSYQLNGIGSFIVEQLLQLKTADEIVGELSDKYKMPKKEIYIDVHDFMMKLKIYGLV